MQFRKLFSVISISLLFLSNGLYAQDSENIDQINTINNSWLSARKVTLQGNYAYVAVDMSGLAIVDVSDPENPVVTGRFNDNPGQVLDVEVSGDYAYLTDDVGGLLIIDISDPANPSQIGNYEINYLGALSIFLEGDYAYVNFRDHDEGFYAAMVIFDVSNPANPDSLGAYTREMSGFFDVYVTNNYAYVVGFGGMQIIDVSRPDFPQEVANSDIPSFASGIDVSGDHAYITGFNGFSIFNIADPSAPEEVAIVNELRGSTGIQVNNQFAFVTNGQNGFHIIDISDPEQPEAIGSVDIPGSANGVYYVDNYAYVAADYERTGASLRILDCSDPAEPAEVGFYDSPGANLGVFLSGNYCYILEARDVDALTGNGIRIADISNVANPDVMELYQTPGFPADIHISGNYAYIAAERSGLRIVEISNHRIPEEIGHFDTEEWATGILVEDNIAYLVDWSPGLRLIDVSDPTEPEELSIYRAGSLSGEVYKSGDFVYTVQNVYDNDIFAYRGSLRVIDVSDPNSPEQAGVYETDGFISALYVYNTNAYITVNMPQISRSSLTTLDISNPADPSEIYSSQSEMMSKDDIFVDDNYIYVAGFITDVHDFGGILQVIDRSNPRNHEVLGYYRTGANEIYVHNGLIYVASGSNVGIYRFTDPGKVDDPAVSIPAKFNLASAYPNPFNSMTTVTYSLPVASRVSLNVYDLSGRIVTTLDEGQKQAGVHRTTLNASNLPTGLYFVQLKASDQIFTQKVMLIR